MSEPVIESRIAFRFDTFDRHPVRHAMSGRLAGAEADGDVGHGPNTIEDVIERNRRAFVESAGFSMADLVISRQTHGTRSSGR